MNYWKNKNRLCGMVMAFALCCQCIIVWGEEPKSNLPLKRYQFSQVIMGVDFTLLFYAPSEAIAKDASEKSFEKIKQLDAIYSDYKQDSELMQLFQNYQPNQPNKVSKPLIDVLLAAETLSKKTSGAFDVTIGPAVRLWRRSRRQRELPSEFRIKEAKELIGYTKLKLNKTEQTVTFCKSDMRLDLGGIAKGTATEAALKVLREQGIQHALVDGSGDISIGDPPPGKKYWRASVTNLKTEDAPKLILNLKNMAVATSGDAYQYVEIAGIRYSHIIDPKTCLGVTHRSSVTIIAPDCQTADSIASAVTVLGPETGIKFIGSLPQVEAHIVVGTKDGLKSFSSKGWSAFVASVPVEKQESKSNNKE